MKPEQCSSFNSLVNFAFSRYTNRVAFIEDSGREVTYTQAQDLLARLIPTLKALGVGPGSAVAGLSQNRSEIYLTELATAALGGRYAGLHLLASSEEHAWMCDDGEIEFLVIDPAYDDHASQIMERSDSVSKLLSLGPSTVGRDLLELAGSHAPVSLTAGPPVSQDDIQRIIYTGGTTGRSKGVALTHRAVAHMVLTAPTAWQMPRRPNYLATSPITHAAFLQLLPTLLAGGTAIFHRAYDPDRWLKAIDQNGVNLSFMVPTMIYSALDSPLLHKVDLSALETVTYGGSPMSPTRLAEGLDRLGPVFTQIYGQTECLAMGTSLWKNEHDPEKLPDLMTSCGRPVPGVQVDLVDLADQPVEPGQSGEVVIRSATSMKEYWKQPELTEETVRNGWLHTGDIARRDDKGFFHIVDRKKDMIVSGGFNIFPSEIEDVLTAHPDVSAVAVIGVPDAHWGEQVKAVVVLRPGAEVHSEELQALVRAKKGSYYAPKSIDFVSELPLTGVGKIDKRVLRGSYWSGESRNVH